jgi:hypothetical protein
MQLYHNLESHPRSTHLLLGETRHPHSEASAAMLSSTPSLLSIHSLDTAGKHLPVPLAEVRSDLVPLPEEKYPREIEAKKPDHGYYIALGMILSVWMITPLSWWAPRSSDRL